VISSLTRIAGELNERSLTEKEEEEKEKHSLNAEVVTASLNYVLIMMIKKKKKGGKNKRGFRSYEACSVD